MPDSVDFKLGNYRIVRPLGHGGFANVYLGEHIYLKIPAAIKVLNIHLVNDALESFLNEARIIALLEHPRIIRVLEFGVESGRTPFLVMNYAENGTLRQRYPKKSTPPWPTILSYTKQVAEALQYAHDHGVIHRDVKPENMLLGKNQRIQLSDFGLALLAQNISPHAFGSAGTTAYMAPEQLQGNPCPASDQYALGVVVYEWLCGSLPFAGTAREMRLQQLYAAPPSIRSKVPGISPAIEQVIMKALEKDPQARFATVQEFAQALEQGNSPKTLLDTEKGRATSPEILSDILHKQADKGSLYNPAQQQEPMGMPSASNFFPQLPLVVYESPLTNSRRIVQPSLRPSINPPDELSLPMAFSLNELSLPTNLSSEDVSTQSSHTFLPPSTSGVQVSPDLVTPASLPVTQSVSFPQIQARNSDARAFSLSRRTAFIALSGLILIGLILLVGTGIWPQNIQALPKASLNQLGTSPTSVHATAISSTASPHSGAHRTATNVPVVPTHSPASSGSTPVAAPVPTQASQPIPTPQPIPVPTSVSNVTPTPDVPLTVAIVSAPTSARAGSTITVITQASKGGVTIALDGVLRHFGQQTANKQGVATFQISVPLLGTGMVLTATATDANGDQVQSGHKSIRITLF